MSYPDSFENSGRTMLALEGTKNRNTHIIQDRKTKKLRLLTAVECESLNQFPDNYTSTMSNKRRCFMIGNALITVVIKKLGYSIEEP